MKATFPIRLLALLGMFAISAFGQTAQLTGTVNDKSGSSVPGAKIVATNIATGVARATVANESGNYLITALLPGGYRVSTEAPGFKQVNQGPVTLEVDQVARLDFTLEVGETRDSVTVEASAVLLDSATSTLGTTVENRQIAELPLNGRDPIDLLALSAGIRIQAGFGGKAVQGGTPGGTWQGYSFNGGIAGSNATLVEGLALDMAQMNSPSFVPPADATQEFRAQTNKFSAEYGRTTGAVVSISIKSGTNELHGSLYEFFRNRDLNANNFFQNRVGNPRAPFNQNQFGGTVGGPIKRDKTFFFVNFEEYRQVVGAPGITSVPTALQRAGDFSQTFTAAGRQVAIADPLTTRRLSDGTYTRDVFPNNVIPRSQISRVASNVAQVFPLPTLQGQAFTNVNNYSTLAANATNEHQIVSKFDHNLNARWKIFGTYARDWLNQTNADPFGYKVNLTRVNENDRHHATISATAVFSPGLIGEFHSGFARLVVNTIPQALGFDITTLGFPKSLADQTQIQSFPAFSISGLAGIGGSSSAGLSVGAFNSWGERASMTWVKGPHTIKFGGDFRVQQMNHLLANSLEPLFNFTNQMSAINPLSLNANSGVPMASFMLGYVSSASVAKTQQMANQRKYLSFFLQDDWKVTRKLTLNVGMDYSLEFPITERHNRKMWLDPTAQLPISQVVELPLAGGFRFADDNRRAPFDLYTRQFGPRVGFAYQLFPHTVLRSGYGLFWIPAAMTEVTGDTRAPAWAINTPMVTSLDGGVTPYDTLDSPYPNGLQNPPGNSRGLNTLIGQDAAANIRSYHTGYMQQWNFNIEQQLARESVLDVSYAGSAGVGLPAGFAAQQNQLADSFLSLGPALQQLVPNPFASVVQSGPLAQPLVQRAQLLRPYPQFQTLFAEGEPAGHSNYHSFQLQFKQRFSTSLITVAYTISKAIGNTEARLDTGGNSTNAAFVDTYNRRLNRSLSAYDVPQRLVVSYTLELPFGKGRRLLNNAGPAGWLVSGWQVNGIYTAQSGIPIGVAAATNLTGNLNAVTDVYGTFVSNAVPNNNGQSAKLSGSPKDRLNQWFTTSVFSQPAPYTYGTAPRMLPDVRADGTNNIDFSFFKNNRFGHDGRFNLQFRSEFFNLANHVRFGAPGATFGNATLGVVSSQANNPRQIQLALRLLF